MNRSNQWQWLMFRRRLFGMRDVSATLVRL